MKVKQGQNLLDMAGRYAGSLEGIIDIANDNGISPTDDLQVGQQISIGSVQNADVVRDLSQINVNPATRAILSHAPRVFGEEFPIEFS